jgi:protein-L-isoaspartate(D-aspartate) O-methyltransferase
MYSSGHCRLDALNLSVPASHYFQANLPKQFDEYIWVDRTQAVTPIEAEELKGLPDTYSFGL